MVTNLLFSDVKVSIWHSKPSYLYRKQAKIAIFITYDGITSVPKFGPRRKKSLKRQCRYWSEIWIHGGPQIFLKLRYFEGINDTSWIPKALAPKWTHSRNNEQQRNPWIINLLKHMNLESLSLGEICIQFLSYLDWNLVSMISFERIQKICSATPWGRVIMNNWWGGPKY